MDQMSATSKRSAFAQRGRELRLYDLINHMAGRLWRYSSCPNALGTCRGGRLVLVK